MSWSLVNTNSGSVSSVTSYTPTFPSGCADGDIVAFASAFTPDDGSRIITTSTPNWKNGPSGAGYFVYARYSAALAAPVITVTNSLTASASWFGCAFRSTKASAFGTAYEAAGAPPTGASVTVVALDTLIVCAGVTPGLVESWNIPSGFSSIYNLTGGPSISVSYQSKTSQTTVYSIRETDIAGGSVRTIVLAIGEGSSNFMFME
jgi:hypothetical protein